MNNKEEQEDRVFHRPHTIENHLPSRFANSPTTTTYLASTEGNKNNDHSIRSGQDSLKTLQGRKASAVNQEEIICEEQNHKSSFKVHKDRAPSLARKLRSEEGYRETKEMVSEKAEIFEKGNEEQKGEIVSFDQRGRVQQVCQQGQFGSRPDNLSEEELVEHNQSFQIQQRKVRMHGFQCPLNWMQIISWILFFSDLITFYTLNLFVAGHQSDDTPSLVVLSLIFAALAVGILTATVIATRTDPTDPLVKEERDLKEKGFIIEPKQDKFYCKICQTHVQTRTKHCGDCNRCVSQFDHHCKWLNTCVGGRNY